MDQPDTRLNDKRVLDCYPKYKKSLSILLEYMTPCCSSSSLCVGMKVGFSMENLDRFLISETIFIVEYFIHEYRESSMGIM